MSASFNVESIIPAYVIKVSQSLFLIKVTIRESMGFQLPYQQFALIVYAK